MLLKRLAVGGMAELFLAKDTRSDRMVVLKRILPYLAEEAEFVHMFLDEARIAASLHHANIVELLELGRLDGSTFIAMEWVNGIDLRRILTKEKERGGVVSAGVAAWMVARLCEGLHYAHQRTGPDGTPLGIIHRDVSPQNVMISFRGDVKLVDFGIAKATAWMSRSKPGIIKGKFLYLAPEQVSQDKADARADLFAVGILLYELTCAKSPFFRATSEEVIYAIRTEDPDSPVNVRPGFPVALSRIIMKCLQKDRAKRYQSADEVRVALDDFVMADAPTTRADVSRYLSTLFGNENERTSVYIPPNAQTPEIIIQPSSVPLDESTASTARAVKSEDQPDDEATVTDMPPGDDRPTASMPRVDARDEHSGITKRDDKGGLRFELDEIASQPERSSLAPPVPTREVPAHERPSLDHEPTEGAFPPFIVQPPPLPVARKAPKPSPPRAQAAAKPPPPVKTPTAPKEPVARRRSVQLDPDDLVSTVDMPRKDVERKEAERRARRPVPPRVFGDRRGQYVLLGIVSVSALIVLILLVLVLWPPAKMSPGVGGAADGQVHVTVRGARASRVTVDGQPLLGDSFDHAPGPVKIMWRCPPAKKKGPFVDRVHSFEVPASGPVLFELFCP